MAQKVRIIGVPMDLGQSRRGVDMGPSALRVRRPAGAPSRSSGITVEDIGNMAVKQPEEMPVGEKRAKYLQEIAETCRDMAKTVEKSLTESFLRWCLAGTIPSRLATAAGVAQFLPQASERHRLHLAGRARRHEYAGILAVRQRSRHAAGRHDGLRAPELVDLMGFQPKAEPGNIVIVGAAGPGRAGTQLVKKSGVHAFTMRDIDERGMREVMTEALKYRHGDTAGMAVSLDMDFVDPTDAPGVGTPVRGGVTYREAHLAMEMIADSEAMVSLEVVEINPVIDEHNRTALLGVELVLSALGKKIL